jgi:hypothetical protein
MTRTMLTDVSFSFIIFLVLSTMLNIQLLLLYYMFMGSPLSHEYMFSLCGLVNLCIALGYRYELSFKSHQMIQ